MAGTATGEMIEKVTGSPAGEVLGAILEQQARDRDWVYDTVVAGKDREIEELRAALAEAHRELVVIRRRVLWLLGGELVEDLR